MPSSATARERRVTLIGDGGDWLNYESSYRPLWTSWFREHRRNIDSVHLLVRSPFLRMGVQVVNLVSDNIIKTYNDRTQLSELVSAQWPTLHGAIEALEQRAMRLVAKVV